MTLSIHMINLLQRFSNILIILLYVLLYRTLRYAEKVVPAAVPTGAR